MVLEERRKRGEGCGSSGGGGGGGGWGVGWGCNKLLIVLLISYVTQQFRSV